MASASLRGGGGVALASGSLRGGSCHGIRQPGDVLECLTTIRGGCPLPPTDPQFGQQWVLSSGPAHIRALSPSHIPASLAPRYPQLLRNTTQTTQMKRVAKTLDLRRNDAPAPPPPTPPVERRPDGLAHQLPPPVERHLTWYPASTSV